MLVSHRRTYGVKSTFFGEGARACFPDKTWFKSAARRFAREHRRHEAHGRGSGALPQKIENFEKMIAGNAFSKHFRRFLVTLKEGVISSKRQAELDSDPKMNQTER